MSGSDGSGDRGTTGGAPSRGRGRRPKSPIDQWFEVFVYAPLGFALDARQLFPRFVDRGRSQVVLARVVGQVRGAARLRTGPSGYLGDSQTQVAAVLQALGLLPEEHELDDDGDVAAFEADHVTFAQRPVEPSPSTPTDASAAASPDRTSDDVDPRTSTRSRSRCRRPRPSWPSPTTTTCRRRRSCPASAASRPTSSRPFAATRSAARGRKTILGKIAQLQSA